MFFGLTNSLAIFQIIINKILWNLINIRKVTSFINNIIVRMERKEKYDEIVIIIIIIILVENNLYIKLEK